MYEPRPVLRHATEELELSPSCSVISPRAPGRIAKIGRSGARPLATMMTPFEKMGVGAVIFELPPSRHRSSPVAGSYPRMKLEALVTSSARPRAGSTTAGVPQDGSSCRSVLHTVLPSANVGRKHERSLLRVALNDHHVLVDDRRAGVAPFVLGQIVGACVQDTEILLPYFLAVDVVGIETLRPEERDDVTAVGRRRGVRVGGLDVTLLARRPLVRRPLPDRLARAAVDRHHHPAVHGSIF